MNLAPDLNVDRVIQAQASDGLSQDTYARLLDRFLAPPAPEAWKESLRHWFLVGGLLLLVSGIIFFGAYNWEHLGRLQKLGLLQTILIALFSGVLLRGVESREGQVLLVSASAVVGGLLAAMGQAYQTGADSYQLFLDWAILILPWCLAGRMNVLWTSQIVLLDVAFTLWWYQAINDDFMAYAPAFLLFNLTLFATWEILRRRVAWMSSATSDLLMAAGLTPVTLAACAVFIDNEDGTLSLLSLAVVLAGMVFFRGKRLISMATVSASLLCLGTTLLGRICLEGGEEFGVLMVGVGIMAQIALIVKWLTHLHKSAESSNAAEQIADTDTCEKPGVEEFSLTEEEYGALAKTVSLPWYVQTLIGTGAWFASLFVLIFFLLLVSGSDDALIVFGFFLYGGTLFLRSRGEPTLFFRHALLSVHISGVLVTMFGLAEMSSRDEVAAGLVGAVLLAVSALLYQDTLGIFLFSLGFAVCGVASTGKDEFGAVIWLVVVMLFISYLSLCLRKLLQSRLKQKALPAIRGLSAGLLVSVMILNFDNPVSGILLAMALGATAITVGYSRLLQQPVLAQIGLLIVGLLTYTVPALTASIFVYFLGFRTQQKLLRGFGILAVAASGFFFYYSLDLTFMAKSLALISSGGGLLLFRVLLGRQGKTDEEVDSYAL